MIQLNLKAKSNYFGATDYIIMETPRIIPYSTSKYTPLELLHMCDYIPYGRKEIFLSVTPISFINFNRSVVTQYINKIRRK